jgi:hypothetical protein
LGPPVPLGAQWLRFAWRRPGRRVDRLDRAALRCVGGTGGPGCSAAPSHPGMRRAPQLFGEALLGLFQGLSGAVSRRGSDTLYRRAPEHAPLRPAPAQPRPRVSAAAVGCGAVSRVSRPSTLRGAQQPPMAPALVPSSQPFPPASAPCQATPTSRPPRLPPSLPLTRRHPSTPAPRQPRRHEHQPAGQQPHGPHQRPRGRLLAHVALPPPGETRAGPGG